MVYFHETTKGLVLNKTNALTIAELYGNNISEWEDKKIKLFTTEVSLHGKPTLGIRVRLRQPEVSGKQPAETAEESTKWID